MKLIDADALKERLLAARVAAQEGTFLDADEVIQVLDAMPELKRETCKVRSERPAMDEATCKTCPWWDEKFLYGTACKKNPPKVGDIDDRWPTAGADDWCGKHPLRRWNPDD